MDNERIPEDTPAPAGKRPARVLVVDDEAIARENVGHALRREGHAVRLAADGREALELLAQEPAEVVVSDIKMERMDGQELLTAIRQRYPEAAVIMVTGYVSLDSAVAAMKCGAGQYLPKPLDLDELRRAVRELIENRGRREGGQGVVAN